MRKIDLNGQWDFIADLDPKYHEDKRIHPIHPYSQPETVRRHWSKASVPGVWQKYGERYDIFEGVCWFAREFYVDGTQYRSAYLRFGGVNYFCDVYVNGKYAGSHEGGYTEFVINVAGHIREGRNHIAVRADNRAPVIKWPPCLGYFNYGGIHRSVVLELAEGARLHDVTLTAAPLETGYRLGIKVLIKDCAGELTLKIYCGSQSVTIPVFKDGAVESSLVLPGIRSWQPDDPVLYEVGVELIDKDKDKITDTYTVNYGFKTISVKKANIVLNDKIFKFNGICYVYDSPVSGLTMTNEQTETDLRLMKEMGVNAVRCHYPMDKIFYEACDRMGILVWIEPPVYCYHPGDNEINTRFTDMEWLALANNMITEMIRVAKNHPSVAIYGIGNECNAANSEAENFFTSLAATARREDPTRLVSYAALYGIVGALADLTDILGINSYWGWYDKQISNNIELVNHSQKLELEKESIDLHDMRKMLDKVIGGSRGDLALFLTEFGADSIPGFYAAGRNLWSENYHADILEKIFSLADEYPQIAGTFPFCFTDYRDPSKTANGYWNELNLKGAVSYNREKKLAFEAIRGKYTRKCEL